MKTPSYTKKEPGRIHNTRHGGRKQTNGKLEPRGNKPLRKAMRKHIGINP